MPQLFRRSANTLARLSLIVGFMTVGGSLWMIDEIQKSPYATEVELVRDQPVPFSHQHHISGLGIDCRYCHTSVEKSSFAGIPPTATCMNCHSQIWADSPTLEPVRESYRTGEAIEWNRIYDLPDFVYFRHDIHVAKGVACTTCHGNIDEQPLTWKSNTLYMNWCLDCHRNPGKYVGPKEKVFHVKSHGEFGEMHAGLDFVEKHKIITNNVNCSVCHR